MLKLYPVKLSYFESGSVKTTSSAYKFGSIPMSSNKCDKSSVKSCFSFWSVSPVNPFISSSFILLSVVVVCRASPSTSTDDDDDDNDDDDSDDDAAATRWG